MGEDVIRYFKTIFLEQVRSFFKSIDKKAVRKILYNVDLAEQINDPRLFKKLNDNIWEFRTKYGNLQYRLLAFWDKSDKQNTLVAATHGIITAEDIRRLYFQDQD
ncbi:type II toxin-antitoxin system RelE/ParE family toxin [Chitinophaga cymbidii]|uniref:type II toxin-antitoxin system RelE/ParE family toxin n=1 Tax=Chitinophaga cymbidii TaxID=1096750 RepID=UPI001C9AF1BE|nr:type II toxin-antitoxin system RelE/ParE family toxin [Chitinophaga cymbidii]